IEMEKPERTTTGRKPITGSSISSKTAREHASANPELPEAYHLSWQTVVTRMLTNRLPRYIGTIAVGLRELSPSPRRASSRRQWGALFRAAAVCSALASLLLLHWDRTLGSTVNMKAGLQTMGVLRSNNSFSQEPVALETTVVATGARPGDTAAKRQLFTEETQTVLVFERGAVIRLSAAVADGQLLFLTNKATGKEVVAQVLRKRAFRPTNCYVDLEFTEAFPGFWGIEFPKSAPALPSQMTSDPGEEEATESVKRSEPPDQQEIERLKKEVAELQNRLKTLSGSATN